MTGFLTALAHYAAKVNAKACGLWFSGCLLAGIAQASGSLSASHIHQQQLQLSNGQQVRLAGVVALTEGALPNGWHQAAITLDCPSQLTNRYQHKACWVTRISDGQLLQADLLQSAKAMLYSDTPHPHITALRPHDTTAFSNANEVSATPARWAAVQGVVADVAILKHAAYLNFGSNWKDDFTIHLPKTTLKAFAPEALLALKGKTIQVRGWLHSYYGPRITLFNPQMMKVLP